jgi:RNA polymerase sigma-70 factor (ECF subfamily)
MNALVLAHFEGLARYAECLLHSRDDAEDVAQDVLARVWNHHAEWMPATSVQAYLLGAVRNRVIDMRRRVSSRARRDVQFQGEHPVALPPDALLSDAEEEAVLRNAIAQLSDRWREVIALRYEQQIAFREIGRILGISEDAAKKLARRAVAELRRSLGL